MEGKENKLEKWEDISGLLSLSLSFLWLSEVSLSNSLLYPVALIPPLLPLHLILNCHVFQCNRSWNRALQQEHCLVKAVVPPLAPFSCFHPKSHPSSLQGSPRERRRPTSLRGDGNKAETSLHSFLLLIPCSFYISAASGQSHTHLSSAAFRVSSSSSRPGRESSEFLGDALPGGGEHSSLSGSYNISHYVPVVKSDGFIIFYATNGIVLKEAAAAFYH